MLLQVLDEGRLTDGKGRVVNFKNTIIIMTSNMASELILQRLVGRDYTDDDVEEVSQQVMQRLKAQVLPEFLNRIEEVVMFRPLSRADIAKIAQIQLQALVKKLKRNDLEVSFDPAALAAVAAAGYQPEYGGRPVKRAINDLIVNPLSLAMINGEVDRTRPIRVVVADDAIKFVNV